MHTVDQIWVQNKTESITSGEQIFATGRRDPERQFRFDVA
jgi:hypothetical protein